MLEPLGSTISNTGIGIGGSSAGASSIISGPATSTTGVAAPVVVPPLLKGLGSTSLENTSSTVPGALGGTREQQTLIESARGQAPPLSARKAPVKATFRPGDLVVNNTTRDPSTSSISP
ncbi:unnamed protein product, partial [Amoebophrya sp. A25]